MSARSIVAAACFAVVSVASAVYLMDLQFSAGDAYPELSSLRSDPRGAKLLYDALVRMPGLNVTRNYLPLEYLTGNQSTVLVLDLPALRFDQNLHDTINRLASGGNRVILSVADTQRLPDDAATFLKVWKVKVGFGTDSHDKPELYFADAEGWTSIDQENGRSRAIERPAGKGAIVLFASGTDFVNSTIANYGSANFTLLSRAIGAPNRIVFDEAHLGIAQSGSVVGLIRRFRLTGMVIGFALCSALFIWRNATSFPPPEPARRKADATGRTSRSGLITLLRRHIPASELAPVCWNEWLSVNRRALPGDAAESARKIARRESDPVRALQEIQAIVNPKGTL